MYSRQRQRLIVEHVEEHSGASVADLAARFEVSHETIRRDLAALEDVGRIERTHGGAMPAATHAEQSLEARLLDHLDAKRAIARIAGDLLPEPGGSMILDAGSSTAQLLAHMPPSTLSGPGALDIYTDSAPIAAELARLQAAKVGVFGGTVRGITGAIVGSGVVDSLRRLRVDVAFIGANGLHPERGLTTPDSAEAAVKSALVSAARTVVLLADSSKFGRDHVVEFAASEDIDILVTDSQPRGALARSLDSANVEVLVP
ncbi:DeoR/GlpR family DNA-binding transcription regulator [Dietzia sp.]|uniref:DeoR/GlpR family DNA-binding transcription regulator n=1 Tax=Dietzia sp. TaxID=1871616 RepID=UPI002FDA8B36